MSLVALWFRAFLLTTGVELAVATPALGSGVSLLRRVPAIAFAQLASHPLVWFVLPHLGFGRAGYLVMAESWALLVELLVYRLIFERLPWRRALAASALANGASLAVGTFFF